MVTGSKGGKNVAIYWFDTTDHAKEMYDALKKEYDKAKEEDPDSVKDSTLGRSGKMVYAGNKEAIKAAR